MEKVNLYIKNIKKKTPLLHSILTLGILIMQSYLIDVEIYLVSKLEPVLY